MPLVVGGILGMWFVAPLVRMEDPVLGWVTFAICGATMLIGGLSELWP